MQTGEETAGHGVASGDPDRLRAIEELITTRPAFHGPGTNWALPEGPSRWLAARVKPGWRTVETGCGASTALFALLGSTHTVIAPHRHEHEAALDWCRARGFATEHVTSIVSLSQDAVPNLPDDPLDLAMIDGAHSFPVPMIDWYYLGTRLKTGGFMLVDDMHIRSPRLLRDFLKTDKGRWEPVDEVDGMAIFRKTTTDPLIPGDDWLGQAWNRPPLPTRIRAAVRLRTRLRDLAGRPRP